MIHSLIHRLIAIPLILITTMLVPFNLHAASCASAATVASDVWKEYRKVTEALGCKTKLGGLKEYTLCSATRLVNESLEDVVGWWNSGAKNRWSTIGPRTLGAETEYGTVVAATKRTFVSMVPSFNKGSVIVTGKSGQGKVTICAIDSAGKQYRLYNDEPVSGKRSFNINRKDAEGRILSVVITPKAASFKYEIKKTETPIKWNFGKVRGLADLHAHGAAELGFGGMWTWGGHDGPKSHALGSCGTLHAKDGLSLAAQMGGLPVPEKKRLHALPINSNNPEGETVVRHGNGYAKNPKDAFKDWPHFSDIAHMQLHSDWLREAHKKGLKLIVMSAVNNELLCRALRVGLYQGNNKYACDDMSNLNRQLDAFNALDDRHDWLEVALTPWHARKIIHENKLAVILSVESSHTLPPSEGDFTSQLDKMYQKGLRSMQIVHERDNSFSGAAPHRPNFWPHQITSNPLAAATLAKDGSPFLLDSDRKNRRGLTSKGKELIGDLVRRRMLIDISHYSERAVDDLYSLVTKKYDKYPYYASHSRFSERLHPEENEVLKELVTTKDQVRQLKDVGGMVGVRTGPNHVKSDPASGVDNDCPGSSRSYAQFVSYAKEQGLDIAFGSDFNGVTQQVSPRLGSDGCYAASAAGRGNNDDEWNRDQKRLKGAVARFETEGLKHIGYLPDLYTDLVALGTNGVEQLNNGAENFIVMWEKAHSARIEEKVNSNNACQVDTDCGLGRFCKAGLDFKPNTCEALKNDNASCAAIGGGHQCKGGKCAFSRCYTPNAVAMGGTCYVDAACGDGKCSSIDGTRGTCVCKSDTDCGGGKYCNAGLDLKKNSCDVLKKDTAFCTAARQCKGGRCGLGRCYTPKAVPMGGTCYMDAACGDGKCSSIDGTRGTCVCKNDGDCGSGKWCDAGFDLKKNSCKVKLNKGQSCGKAGSVGNNHKCKSGKCSGFPKYQCK